VKRLALTGAAVVTPFNLIEEAAIIVEGTVIKAVGPLESAEIPPDYPRLDLEGLLIAPGLVDQHLHGGGGAEVNTGTTESLMEIARFHAAHGTTAFLATTLSAARDQLAAVARSFENLRRTDYKGARCLGLHLEGPYLAPEYSGAHSPYTFRNPSLEEVLTIHRLSGGGVKMVTMAPELPGALEIAPLLKKEGIVCAMGHSGADFEEAEAAAEAGFSCVTHCFNQHRPFFHREPGLLGAALTNDALYTEVIVDKVHLHPAAVEILRRAKGSEKIILVTDAMAPSGMPDGSYRTFAGELTLSKGKLTDSLGKLAGSALTLEKAVKNFWEISGGELTDVFRMATYNPAKLLGVNKRKGSLYPGKDADLIVLTPDLEVVATMVEGELISGMITL